MRYAAPISKNTRTTWRTDAREIAAALGIPVGERQWVTLESGDDDGDSMPLCEAIDIVRWESSPSGSYKHEIAGKDQK